ncbi:aromatic amino acid lyase [Leifsonia poae]|uniref:Exported histidine ammonia-lyase n=1 Tax=Leifsonia poae TaxID=110933 RepID=A0A9W6H6Q8_9MICO|nr:aromatic amino acid lyase [Leifsonia poae]GLJ74665.1 exported histidine ammonia-lyase [Leifsonia poae]
MSGPRDVVLGTARPQPSEVVAIADGARVVLAPAALDLLAASRAVVDRAIEAGEPVYGLNRRLGAGRDTAIDPAEFDAFQRRTIRNHRGGVGEPLSRREARAVVAARLVGFTRGGAGVRPELAAAYAAILNADVVPLIPKRGSVGAADLTALAEVAAVVTGDGTVLEAEGGELAAADALAAAGLTPLALAPHEALAALSANAYSVGVGSLAAVEADRLTLAADRAVALSLEAVGSAGPAGNPGAFSELVADARGGEGQQASAAAVRSLLSGSALYAADRVMTVQDPLSFRTASQLHGALQQSVRRLHDELVVELAARSENPVADVASGRLVSGGNFQALPLALDFESLRVALAHVAAASERRSAALSLALAPARADGRTRVPGLVLYAAAADAAELRQLAAPVTLGSTTLSGVEDHASLAPLALQTLQRSLELTREVLAIEALHASDLLHAGGSVPAGHGTGPLAAAVDEVIGSGVPARELVTRAADALFADPR